MKLGPLEIDSYIALIIVLALFSIIALLIEKIPTEFFNKLLGQ